MHLSALALVVVAAIAGSQPPPPRSRPQTETQQEKAEPKRSESGDVQLPRALATTANAPDVEDHTQAPQEHADGGGAGTEEKREEKWLARINALSTVVMAAVTIALGVFTWQSIKLSGKAQDSTLAIARGYTALSHKPPGLFCLDLLDGSAEPSRVAPHLGLVVKMQVKNHGQTPATVLTEHVTLHIGEMLPPSLPILKIAPGDIGYSLFAPGEYMLMAGESSHSQHILSHRGLNEEEFRSIQTGQLKMWVLGYVEYVDVFGVRRRAGYARYYSPLSPERNLAFETERGFNYDREIKQG